MGSLWRDVDHYWPVHYTNISPFFLCWILESVKSITTSEYQQRRKRTRTDDGSLVSRSKSHVQNYAGCGNPKCFWLLLAWYRLANYVAATVAPDHIENFNYFQHRVSCSSFEIQRLFLIFYTSVCVLTLQLYGYTPAVRTLILWPHELAKCNGRDGRSYRLSGLISAVPHAAINVVIHFLQNHVCLLRLSIQLTILRVSHFF